MTSFGQRLSQFKGFGPGFDFARIFLAFAVLSWHSPLMVTGDQSFQDAPGLWVLNYSILPMFFGLSGFLIAGSAQRLNLQNFLLNRGLRILPALAVEIVLSALVLGPIFTVTPLAIYFRSPQFFTYFLNIFGIVHYHLPGVFLSNPHSNVVNGSLWTVPFEMICYAVMSLLIITGAIRRGMTLLGLACGIVALGVIYQLVGGGLPHNYLRKILDLTFLDRGALLLPCFLLGASAYTLRDRLPYDFRLFAACVITALILNFVGNGHWVSYAALGFVMCPVFMYIMLYVGLSKLPKLPYFGTGDYSYGVYLYGFPIQQMLMSTLHLKSIWLHWIFSVIAATLFATFSWHCIEKHILAARKNFSFVARKEREHEAAVAPAPGSAPEPGAVPMTAATPSE